MTEMVKPDPAKPYKAIIGAVITFLATLLASIQGAGDLSDVRSWVLVVVSTLVTFAGVYQVTNPKVVS